MMSPRFSETRASKESCMAHAAKEGCVGKLSTNVGVLNGGFTDANGNHVAHDHHQSNFGGPGESGRGDREEMGQ